MGMIWWRKQEAAVVGNSNMVTVAVWRSKSFWFWVGALAGVVWPYIGQSTVGVGLELELGLRSILTARN